MLTAQAPAPQLDRRAGDRELVRRVFDRAGTPVQPALLDFRLAALAAETAELLMRAVEEDTGPPILLVTDLLTVVSALREVLGMRPTPVNSEVFWGA